jgi:hypothetical protein
MSPWRKEPKRALLYPRKRKKDISSSSKKKVEKKRFAPRRKNQKKSITTGEAERRRRHRMAGAWRLREHGICARLPFRGVGVCDGVNHRLCLFMSNLYCKNKK